MRKRKSKIIKRYSKPSYQGRKVWFDVEFTLWMKNLGSVRAVTKFHRWGRVGPIYYEDNKYIRYHHYPVDLSYKYPHVDISR